MLLACLPGNGEEKTQGESYAENLTFFDGKTSEALSPYKLHHPSVAQPALSPASFRGTQERSALQEMACFLPELHHRTHTVPHDHTRWLGRGVSWSHRTVPTALSAKARPWFRYPGPPSKSSETLAERSLFYLQIAMNSFFS